MLHWTRHTDDRWGAFAPDFSRRHVIVQGWSGWEISTYDCPDNTLPVLASRVGGFPSLMAAQAHCAEQERAG
jgi:hypothetical protein